MHLPSQLFRFKTQILVLTIVLLALGGAGYFYWQNQATQNELKKLKLDPKIASKEEAKKLVEKVSKLVDLPQAEEPIVATVTDSEKLKSQSFFAKAKNGDKVLIYTQAKRAYLYDSQADKILEIAPINIGDQTAQIENVRVVLRNGTTTVGLTNKIEPEVKKALANSEIVAKENAAKTDYEKTIVIVIDQGKKSQAEQLSKALGATVSVLPEGEIRPDAAILVIVGRDKI